MMAFLITTVICITFLCSVIVLCVFLGDSTATYLEAKAEELRAQAAQLRKENKG